MIALIALIALIASGSKSYESVGSGSLVGVTLPSDEASTDAHARLVPKWEGNDDSADGTGI